MHRTNSYFKKLEKPGEREPMVELAAPGVASNGRRINAATYATPTPPSHEAGRRPKPPLPNAATDFLAAVFEQGDDGRVVMDPMAVLRQCIRYFSSHPEVYGTDMRAILDREVMHVMRLKASEVALIGSESVQCTTDCGIVPVSHAAPSTMLPPLLSATKYAHGANLRNNGSSGDTPTGGGAFGYGGISFVQPTAGLLALLKTTTGTTVGPSAAVSEPIAWEGLLPRTDLEEARLGSADSNRAERNTAFMSGGTFLQSFPPTTQKSVVVDGVGYEVAFLRGELQQLEAAYNAKCVRLHELVDENSHLLSQLKVSNERAEKYLASWTALQAQLEVMKRELDGWKERAHDAQNMMTNQRNKHNSQSRRNNSTQLSDAKAEVTKLTELWRGTERALQESRRAFENSEKEANMSHDHLSDSFRYIERLERRVHRRNQFIHLANRRQRSLEEKYEKLMWCFRELGTMSGAHSYVDHLLAENPIWTLFLFVHLQRQAGSFLPVSIPTEPNCPDTTAPRNSLTFFRSINGGTFVDECYDPTTVYDVMASEATALNERRRKVKQVRTNLHGTVACRTLRWLNAYSLDFLGGEDTNPDSSPVNRRKLPILTLASLIVPLRKPDGTRVVPLPPLPEPTEDGEPAPAVDDSLHDLVPNTKAYSQSTIRFVLRSFWKERLSEYEREMDRHAHEAVEHAARRESRATSGSSTIKGVEVEAGDTRSSDDDEVPVRNTFLAALIIFAIRFLHPNLAEAELTEAELAAVRGVPSRSERNMWDGGRLFFATVMHAKSRRPAAFASDEAPPPPPDISPGVAELLCALYYYTMEYRDHDADFRLFYLVSHQLIPEMVGINFYASIEAFQADGVAALRRWLHTPIPDGQHLGDAEAPHKDGEEDDFMPFADPNDPKASSRDFRTDQPLGALARVATLVDQTPLIGELEEAEEDSDGEGFGTILPGRNHTASPPKASPDITNTERSTSAISVHSNSERRSERSTTPSPDRLLVHGLREYLDELRHRRDGEEFTADPSPLEGPQYKEDDVFPAWELVDHRIHAILGPHSSILADYDEARSTGIYGKLRFDRTRAQRATMDNVKRRTTAAMRGLLPLHEVLRLFHRHCFTTYAVTCCGVPRFSLASALFPPTSTSLHDYLPPLQPVGQVPPSGLHLQRLRFALALDQPSSLIHFSRIFDYDPHTTSPSHFYQEYLTLTLDVFLQQQKFMMDAVLRSCAARHERYAAEGAEDCDGNLPVASLKKGMLNTFDRLGLDASQAISFMHHLMQYDKLLLHEDEVKLEQFTDAPFYINTGPDSSRAASANGPIPPTTNNDDFNLMEESQSCSLLHLSLAVRMLYIVWGPNATEAARTLISNSATLPITDSTQEEHRPSSRVVGAKAPVYASEKQLARAATAAFEEEVKGAYLSCAHRLERGNAGMENPLRRVTAPVEDDRRNSASLSNSVSQLQMPSTPTQSGGGSPSKHRTTFTLGAYPTCQNLLTPNVKPATAAEAAAAANETAKTRAKKKKSLVDPLHAQRLQMLIQGRASNLQASLDASTFVLARLLGLQASQCGSLKAKAKKVKKVAKKEEKESPSAGLHGLSAFGATVMLERLRTKVDLLVCEQEDELAEKLVIPGTPVVAAKKAGKTRTRQGSQKKVVFEEGKRPELPRRLSNLGRWAPSFEDPTPSVATDQTPTRSSKEASKKTAKIPINVSRLRSSCAALSLL